MLEIIANLYHGIVNLLTSPSFWASVSAIFLAFYVIHDIYLHFWQEVFLLEIVVDDKASELSVCRDAEALVKLVVEDYKRRSLYGTRNSGARDFDVSSFETKAGDELGRWGKYEYAYNLDGDKPTRVTYYAYKKIVKN